MLKRSLTLCLVAAVTAALFGCSHNTPDVKSTVGATGSVSTASTAAAIEKKIQDDPAMAGAQVKVSEKSGSIALEGTVKTTAQKDRAEQIVTESQQAEHKQTGVLDDIEIADTGSGAGADKKK